MRSKIFFMLLFFVKTDCVRVCPSFFDYYTSKINLRCHDNPDGEAKNVEEIVRRWGFSHKQYEITTEDKYIITVERISHVITKKTRLVLGTGIAMSSMVFVDRGIKSIAYVLAKEGYDVWLINWRGTRFSRKHKSLSPNDYEFWKTGFQDMANHDLKETLSLIHKETEEKAIYIGYSMGTTIGFAYNLDHPVDANKYLKGILSMAPALYFKHATALLITGHDFWPLFLRNFFKIVSHGEVLRRPKHPGRQCLPFPAQMKFCELLVKPLTGSTFSQIDPLTYPVTIKQNTDSIASGTVEHFYQLIKSKRFQRYDHGLKKNLKIYGRAKPTEYKLEDLTVPHALFASKKDTVATAKDAETIYEKIPKHLQRGLNVIDHLNHRDFILAKDVLDLVIPRLMSILKDLDD